MGRIKSVDVARVGAILSVIAIHTVPFENSAHPMGNDLDLATVVNQLARFAVPLFFILSGYFWAQKISASLQVTAVTISMAKRLLFLFVAWSLVYLLPFNLVDMLAEGNLGPVKHTYWTLASVARAPFGAMLQGTKRHLWFLPALLSSLCIAAVFLRHGRKRMLLLVAVLLYLIGLAGKAYSDTPLGFHGAFNFRNGPFFHCCFLSAVIFYMALLRAHGGCNKAFCWPAPGRHCNSSRCGPCIASGVHRWRRITWSALIFSAWVRR